MKKCLVIGKQSQIGKALFDFTSKYPETEFTFLSREELDLSEPDKIVKKLQNFRFDTLINCAAYTDVDQAEVEVDLVDLINTQAPLRLAESAFQQGALFLHFSTDYVFDGNKNTPYTIKDITNPLSIYGRSKRLSELSILNRFHKNMFIIRTSRVFSPYGNNFIKTILKLSKEKKELPVVENQVSSPTSAHDLADFLLSVARSLRSTKSQLLHFSNEGFCSCYELAKETLKKVRSDCKIVPILSKEYPSKASRPLYSVLDITNTKSLYPQQIPHWEEALDAMLQKI